MNVERIEWSDASDPASRVARAIRQRVERVASTVDVAQIGAEVRKDGDGAALRLTNRFDATERPLDSLRVGPEQCSRALADLDGAVRRGLEIAIANVRTIAEAQLGGQPVVETLPEGQRVSLREVPVGAAGIYAPGGRAAYPSSVVMCAVPAQVAGVERIALASPPGPDGNVAPAVLAAAALCGVEEVYAIGGAQAIFALAYGTESIAPVDVIAGPGNAWVQEAKRAVAGTRVGVDSYAGPSELMVFADERTDARAAALDLCAQAEHGEGAVLALAAVEEQVLERICAEFERLAGERGIVPGTVLGAVRVPSAEAAIELANALAPEHLELLVDDGPALAERVTTAGCVFAGPDSATAFGDYVAGSNHVLPTGGAGRFSGPLGPGIFRRRIATLEVPPEAASKLAPHVDAIARAEGFPVHGESAMIRVEGAQR